MDLLTANQAQKPGTLDAHAHLFLSLNLSRIQKSVEIISLEGDEVKNDVPIEVDLGAETSKLLRTYLRDFRHLISANPGTALFPRKSTNGPRVSGSLSSDITGRIYRTTGLCVHIHLFRHIAAKMYLEQKPGDYETVRRLLGHKKLETTMKFYARLGNKAAFKRFDEIVAKPMRGNKK